MKVEDDVKEKVKQIGIELKYAVNNFECLMQVMPDWCTESEVRDWIRDHTPRDHDNNKPGRSSPFASGLSTLTEAIVAEN